MVIATPGAQPRVKGGYFRAAVILDADATLMYSFLTAHEEAFHRWSDVVSLVTPADGVVVVCGEDSHHVIDALMKRDPVGFARRELQQRRSARMLPAYDVFEIVADKGLWSDDALQLPDSSRVFGPVPVTASSERILISAERANSHAVGSLIRSFIIKATLSHKGSKIDTHVNPAVLF